MIRTLLILCLFATNARCTTWYVDNAAGAGDGTSWANAWNAFSSIVWGASGVNAGDTLYISGGSTSKTYTGGLTVGASGTASDPITIALDAANSSHNGNVIFSGAGITLQKNYITIDGNVGGASHLIITNIYNAGDREAAWAISNYGTAITNTHIRNVTIAWCNNGIKLNKAASYQVGHCLFTNILGDAALCVTESKGGWGANLIYSNRFYVPGWGADRIQCGDGNSIYGNYFSSSVNPGSIVVGQHPDTIQMAGHYIKVYNNDFVDGGDSDIDMGWSYVSGDYSHLWIYNNVFRTTTNRAVYHSDEYPDYIRFYGDAAGPSPITGLSDILICNNTFADNTYYDAVHFYNYWGSPTGESNVIKNNIFYNCGPSSANRALLITGSAGSGFTTSWSVDGNVYYYPGAAGAFVGDWDGVTNASRWIPAKDATGKTNAVEFTSYTALLPGNDFHLSSSDTSAIGGGVDLSAYFTTDKDGKTRGSTWDIGAYQYDGEVNPLSISPSSLSFGYVATNCTSDLTVTLSNASANTITGSATNATSPFTLIGNVNYSLATNETTNVTVRYSPTSVGTNTGTVSWSDGSSTALVGYAYPVAASTNWTMVNSLLRGKMVADVANYVSALSEADSTSDCAVFGVRAASAGRMKLRTLTIATNDSSDSFYVVVNSPTFAESATVSDVWDVLPNTVGAGFETAYVHRRGNGAYNAPQYYTNSFAVNAGVNYIVVGAREANARLQEIVAEFQDAVVYPRTYIQTLIVR